MATRIFANGRRVIALPANGKTFDLETLQNFVGGYIEFVYLDEDMVLVVDEDGQCKESQINSVASMLAQQQIVGNVLLCRVDELE